MAEVQELARDLILGQLRLIIATMEIEEINADRDKFLEAVSSNVESELKKIGLRLINVNITDITDESGYIESLGKEAAAKAINDAKRTVALHDKEGAIGEAEAKRDQRIQISIAEAEAIKGEQEASARAVNDAKRTVALHDKEGAIGEAEARRDQRIQISSAEAAAVIGEAEAKRDQRIQISSSEAEAVKGENEAQTTVALSNAERREKEAEALKRATAAEKVQQALADEEAYRAQKAAELSRAELEQAKMQADIIVKANIDKERLQIEADAEAEQIRRRAMGEAEALIETLTAQAKGNYEALARQAEGITKLVEAAGGNAQAAVQLMIVEKLDELMRIQVEAIKNIKIDRVTVWDSMGGDGKSPSTANFLSGMMKSVPPLNEMFKMAGMEIPAFLGKEVEKEVNADNIVDIDSAK